MSRVLFVCLGNICRSSTAQGVLQAMVNEQGLEAEIEVDSAGTGGWHVGEAPDRRAAAAAMQRGYDLSGLRARQVTAQDFHKFDYILAMDAENLNNLELMRPADFSGQLRLFLDYHPSPATAEVPDPYYGRDGGFDFVLDLVEEASRGLLRELGS
jgi:protein-tyrosine phosphatase